ncbi:MAG: hypothetical protein ACE14M_13500 [Terriglobales bacterium]
MYVLQLEAAERNYLLSLLKRQPVSTARRLATRLRTADKVFGVAMWTDDDIASTLKEHDVPDTPENIRAVRNSFYARHIGDHMVEHGWGVLEEAVCQLKAALKS